MCRPGSGWLSWPSRGAPPAPTICMSNPAGAGDLITAEIHRGPRAGLQVPPHPRFDVVEREGRWASSRLRRPGRRDHPRRVGADRGRPSRPEPWLDGADRAGAVLALLGVDRADASAPPSWPNGSTCDSTPIWPEDPGENDFCMEMFGMRPVDYFDHVGWGSSRSWIAHGVQPDPDECVRLGAWGTGVAHCPSSNMILGAGLAPVRELRAAGAPVGLGVDGSASADSASMWTEARNALLVSRLRDGPAGRDPVHHRP